MEDGAGTAQSPHGLSKVVRILHDLEWTTKWIERGCSVDKNTLRTWGDEKAVEVDGVGGRVCEVHTWDEGFGYDADEEA